MEQDSLTGGDTRTIKYPHPSSHRRSRVTDTSTSRSLIQRFALTGRPLCAQRANVQSGIHVRRIAPSTYPSLRTRSKNAAA